MNRCCARCKHPMVSCRNTSCKCHGSDTDAELLDYLTRKAEGNTDG